MPCPRSSCDENVLSHHFLLCNADDAARRENALKDGAGLDLILTPALAFSPVGGTACYSWLASPHAPHHTCSLSTASGWDAAKDTTIASLQGATHTQSRVRSDRVPATATVSRPDRAPHLPNAAGLPRAIRMGLAFSEQMVPSIPANKFDLPMDHVVSPDGDATRSEGGKRR